MRTVLIVTLKNEARFLPFLFESIKNQDDTKFDLLFVDNGSSDLSTSLIHEFASSSPISGDVFILEEKAPGKINALCTAISFLEKNHMDGIWAFTDADIELSSDWIRRNIDFHQQNIDKTFVFGLERWNLGKISELPNLRQLMTSVTEIRKLMRVTIGGTIIGGNWSCKSERFLSVGGFKPEWFKSEDTNITLEFLRSGMQGIFLDTNTTASPRRLISSNDNIHRWCFDKDIRNTRNIRGHMLWQECRNDSGKHVRDISENELCMSLIIKFERFFKRLVLLSAFDTSNTILAKFSGQLHTVSPDLSEKVIQTSTQERDVVLKCQSLLRARTAVEESIAERNELVRDGGRILRHLWGNHGGRKQ